MLKILSWNVLRTLSVVHARPNPTLRLARVSGDGDIISFPYLLHLHLHNIH